MLKKKEENKGLSYLINWIVLVGDMVLINLFIFTIYEYYYSKLLRGIHFSLSEKLDVFILTNFAFILTTFLIKPRLSRNILSAEKIVQDSITFVALFTVFVTSGIALFSTPQIPIVHWLVIGFVLSILICSWHLIFRISLKSYRKMGYNYRKIALIGGSQSTVETYEELRRVYTGYKVVGYFNDQDVENPDLPPFLGAIDDVEEYIAKEHVDEVYCTLSGEQSARIADIITFCEKSMIRFHLVPDLFQYVKKKLSLQFLETIPVLSLRYEPLQHPLNRLLKRTSDVVISIIAIILTYPIVYLIIAPIIKLSSKGPVHFVQKRTGFRGKEFGCIKLRSMCQNDDANKKSATKGDPRITKIGSFIRKTSIDELPQFINVLKGDMSIVGPRPHMLSHTTQYSKIIEKFMVRHLVKPGITGWAQVTGSRGEMTCDEDMIERVKKDVWYIENWSFFLDMKIIAKTALNAVRGEDKAY